jgi:hypothetical protein
MAKYLTLSQYKRYSDGIPLTSTTDMTLAMTIGRAEAAIDSHMGFDVKHGGFEPHFDMKQSAFTPESLKSWFPNALVPVRNVTRYRIQVSNMGTNSAGFYATLNPGDCVVNQGDGYIEIVPLQAITYALLPELIPFSLRPPIVQMDVEVGFYLPNFGEQLIDSGNNFTYYALDGFWANSYTLALHAQPLNLPPVPPVIYVNGSVVSSSTYTLNTVEGSVTFNSPQTPTSTVTADYTKTIPDQVVEAAVLQTSYLLAQRELNKIGLYKGLFKIRTGEQEIDFPRSMNVGDSGRSTASSLCTDAASVLANLEGWAIA